MPPSYSSLFKQIGENCNFCNLNNENHEKIQRDNYKALVNSSLGNIINSGEDEDIKIAKTSVEICKGCDYNSPRVFRFLEDCRIII